MKLLNIIALTLPFLLIIYGESAQAQLNDMNSSKASVIILNYTRVDEPNYTDTNIQLDQFREQIEILDAEKYSILSLTDIVGALNEGTDLPEKSVAITFDGGYTSIAPALDLAIENHIPVTVFLAMGPISRNSPQFLSPKEILKYSRSPYIDFEITSNDFQRILGNAPSVLEQVNLAKASYRELFNKEPRYFSYPYGEYTLTARDVIKGQNFEAAFAQHSSPAFAGSDIFALPRFAMSEEYANPDRFRLIISLTPLNVSNLSPEDPILDAADQGFGFSLQNPLKDKTQLSCFISDQGKINITFVDERRIELRPSEPLTDRRTRLNCTYPNEIDGETKWQWFGRLFILGQDELPTLQE